MHSLYSSNSLPLGTSEGRREDSKRSVKYCNKPGLYNIQGRLSVCEKALSEYLETKRLPFPRFYMYFISSTDLLDILSKGSLPVEVGVVLLLGLRWVWSCCSEMGVILLL